uniref:Uncharacterized protein n=1 Tax=Acrobeloides nanus TaxID=290746 RepID=A0A914DB20_9BILA
MIKINRNRDSMIEIRTILINIYNTEIIDTTNILKVKKDKDTQITNTNNYNNYQTREQLKKGPLQENEEVNLDILVNTSVKT